jgi:protein associated with RNAse G/E
LASCLLVDSWFADSTDDLDRVVPVTGDLVRVVYRKYDGSLHWNQPGVHLGEDDYGVWVGAPGGTPVARGETQVNPAEHDHVILFPPHGWFTASFNAAPHRTEIYCDITTVPVWPSPDVVTMVDLDLDVRRRRVGTVELLDEDEFAEHQVRYRYPADVIAEARAEAERLLVALRDRTEPFGSHYLHWLELVQTAPHRHVA